MSLHRFILGLFVVWQGLRWLGREPSLRKYILIPFLIDLVILVVGFSIGVPYISGFVDLALTYLPLGAQWQEGASLVLWLLFMIAFLFMLIYGVFLLSVVVAAPFYSLLAERALAEKGHLEAEPFHWQKWLARTLRMLMVSLVKAVVFAFVGILLFIFSLIPGLNLLALIGFAMILSYDVMDYSYEAMGFGFRQRLRHFRLNLDFFSGIALALGLTMVIPGLSLLLVPVGILGGVWNWAEMRDR